MAGMRPAVVSQKPLNWKRLIDDVEIKPCLCYSSEGRKTMGGSVNGELVVDENGIAIPFRQIKHNGARA